MGPASALALAFAVVALCAAVFNLWIFRLRRSEPAHLWLSVAALSIAALSAATGLLYEASSVEQAILIQRFELFWAIPLVLGFLRFSEHFLEIDMRAARRVSCAYMGIVAILSLFPNLLFSGTAKASQVASLGIAFVEAEFTPLGNACFAGFVLVFAHLISRYARHRARIGTNPRPIFVTVCLWFLCGLNDIAVSTDLYEGPFLMAPGFVVFTVAFTAILVHRFVVSVEQVEQSAETLHKLVEQRSEELRKKDLQLAHGERMATLGTLAASVAHEINNPIAFIASNLGQLESIWKPEQGDQEVDEILAETREGVDRIRVIVSELLTLARRGDGIDQCVNLCSVVESVLPILNHAARHRADLHTELNPVPGVLGDERLMGQIVLNLALNAIQAIPEGHRDENRVTISTIHADGSVWLVTRDTGPGIPEDVMPHIFDPFFTTKEKGEGTGLGLAVTHQLVTRYRGRVEVESSGTGTTVTVKLPPVSDPAV